ncbi:MAG: hypothetical protein BAA01_05870 [Bacillus thermozeamaize]|uniref:YokE-like PH domain-containing protein n=1 Tax=Bacillus thermozeamaize TaxID=230954 RepID=A0A1Y3PBV2_9BACI|nr:MAG: hypothetical protein BAA01_05870 [Bacillus thermozeamaize]
MAKLPKILEEAKKHLEPGEQVLEAVLGAYETKLMGKDTVMNGVLIATDRRLVFYGKKLMGYNLEVFPYENISSFEMGKGILGYSLNFYASNNKVSVKWINQGDVKKLTEIVKEKIRKKKYEQGQGKVQANTSTDDVVEQLKKLSELKDPGIITEEEFTAKKKQLLGI